MLIDIHSHHKKPVEGIRIVNLIFESTNNYIQLPQHYSIGIHPWYIENDFDLQLLNLSDFISKYSPKAIGECGLDKIKGADLSVQEKVFRKQIEIAEKHNLPLIIHCVKAFDKVIELKKEIAPGVPWIIHGFDKKPELANLLIQKGFYLSINKISTNTQKALLEIPIEKLFLETDEKTSPISDLYKQVASLKKITREELEKSIQNNFKSVFDDKLAGKN